MKAPTSQSRDMDYKLLDPLVAGQTPSKNDCCFQHCRRSKSGSCWYFWKTRFDAMTCCASAMLLISLLVAVIAPLVLHKLVDDGIADAVVIDNRHASSYDIWQSNYYGHGDKPVINYDVYLFDVQNPHETLNGSKPIVVEKGPYAFFEYYNKFDITWHDDGDVVSYYTQKFYVFNEERTGPGLHLDDQITIPYATVVGFEYLLGTIPASTEEALDQYLEDNVHEIVEGIEETIDQLEQDVIDDPFMDEETKNATLAELELKRALVEAVEAGIDGYIESASAGSSLLKLLLCSANPDGISPYWTTDPVSAYFGWLNDTILVEVEELLVAMNKSDVPWATSVPGATANYTSEDDAQRRCGRITQKTGKTDTKQVGKVVTYYNQTSQWVCLDTTKSEQAPDYVQGQEFPACAHYQAEWTPQEAEAHGYTQAFATEYANRIGGTDGQMFGAPTTSEKIQMYVFDIYRTLFLQYEGDNSDWHGVTLRRYGLQMKDLQNYTMNPSEAWQYYNYAPSGMENLTAATGTTMFVSKPHFLDGDSSLAASVVGMTPKREVHDTFLDIEPNTGALTRAHKRLQLVNEMNNYDLPEMSPEAALAIEALCADNDKNFTCGTLDAMMKCLAIPSNWKFYNDRVYLPYAWADESVEGTSDDADAIKNGIYAADDLANDIRVWGFVVAGLCFAFIVGMFASKLMVLQDKDSEDLRQSFVSLHDDIPSRT